VLLPDVVVSCTGGRGDGHATRVGRGVWVGVDVGVFVGALVGVFVGAEVGVGVLVLGGATVFSPRAAAALIRPQAYEVPVPEMWSDELLIFSTTDAAVALVFCDRIRAASPATCGVAIEVPLNDAYSPVRTVEMMPEPGAATSTPVP
jgi:hypothetical protein